MSDTYPRIIPRWKHAELFLHLLVCMVLTVSTGVSPVLARATKPPVTVEATPETIEYRTFPKGQPPGGIAHFSFEELGGYCDSRFSFGCVMHYEVPRLGFGKPKATITRVEITASLAITIWTEAGSEPGVLGHEESHRTISNHYYAMVDSVARRLATPLIGQQVVLPSRRIDPTDSSPIVDLERKLIEDMHREITDRCEEAQQRFDSAVFGDPPGPRPDARKAAIEEESLDYAEKQQAASTQN